MKLEMEGEEAQAGASLQVVAAILGWKRIVVSGSRVWKQEIHAPRFGWRQMIWHSFSRRPSGLLVPCRIEVLC